MNKKVLFMMFLMFTMVTVSFAKKPPTMPNSYDSMGLSARSFAMGHSGAALPNSLEGVYYNSASLGFNNNEKIQVEASAIVIRNTDLDSNIISYSNPIDLGFTSFVVNQKQGAISWRTLSSNEIEKNNGSDFYKRTENIKALTVSVANLNEAGVSFGLNLSYLYGTLAESSIADGDPFAQTSSGNGFTMDIGIMGPIKGNLYLGVNLENVFGIMWWENYDFDQLPFGIRTGLGYITGTFNLLIDWHKMFYRFGDIENDNLYSVGIEQAVGNVLFLRVGAQGPSVTETDEIKYTYGAGINVSIVSLSIAGETYKIKEENVSQYSVSVKVLI
ncbi:MAG: hypothetical protein K5622_07570 [Endomicrobiaceae bacterium]|nr:hypothetical protein [Endomicrobiaceae bacterium]